MQARILTQLLTIQCPECEETITNPETGSYDWQPSDLTGLKTVTCDSCGKKLTLGKTAKLA